MWLHRYLSIPLLLIWLVHFQTTVLATTFAGKDVTSQLFSNNEDVYPMAYGDFNADKLTDIFGVSRDHSALIIYLGSPEPPLLHRTIECTLIVNLTSNGYPGEMSRVHILGVTPGDFNGDSLMDVMVAFHRLNVVDPLPGEASNPVNVVIIPGNGSFLDCDYQFEVLTMAQEPLMLDVNQDMVMDLFSEKNTHDPSCFNLTMMEMESSKSKCPDIREKFLWIFEKGAIISQPKPVNLTNNFRDHYLIDPDPTAPLAFPHSCAFVDSDGDLAPELVFITERIMKPSAKSNSTKIEYKVKTYKIDITDELNPLFHLMKAPTFLDRQNTTMILGQSIFLDMNHDGTLDHVIPMHSKYKSGGSSHIYILPGGTDDRYILPVDFSSDLVGGGMCHLAHPVHGSEQPKLDSNYTRSIVLRPGDFNLDGFPDLVGIISCTLTTDPPAITVKTFPVLFENIPCTVPKNKASCDYPRTFKINFNDLSFYQNATLATFFDIHEDGLVDILLVRETDPRGEKYGIFAFQNSPDYDANFMKVMVLSGNPCPKCTSTDGIPYGSIIPGPVIRYTMTTQAGNQERAIAAQSYRSAFQALELPYVIFGIGQSPNFVETLSVSVFPIPENNRTQEWLQIIPNSQILVVPSPLNKHWLWKAKLFLTPSKARLYTFGVLVGFCGVIFIIVAVLQWRERREDLKERLEEVHRFHMM